MFCRYGLSPKESQFWDRKAGWRDNANVTSKLKSQVDGQAKKKKKKTGIHFSYMKTIGWDPESALKMNFRSDD